MKASKVGQGHGGGASAGTELNAWEWTGKSIQGGERSIGVKVENVHLYVLSSKIKKIKK